uniref:C2H2-type domain-containing protein n=1 Tax=Davidia involucrata TaxID=16924 RepID=A0A5B6ZE05_DAVIN
MSNISGGGGSFSSGNTGYTEEQVHEQQQQQQQLFNHFINGSNLIPSSSTTANSNDGSTSQQQQPQPVKKRRNQPGNPDPSAEVIALSPKTLMATNRFVCEICNKGFQRDQNLQLHRRGHNLPWKLKQRTSTEIRKRVYVCPESSCVHHNPARALGDLTGIKKHFCRKHGEKKWKCDKCSKKYAVQSDWKAHSKTCGTKEYKCDCGTIFSRRDSFITHRAFCDALTEENNKVNQGLVANIGSNIQGQVQKLMSTMPVNKNPNTSITMSHEFSLNPDTKNPLRSVPHEPLNMAAESVFSRNISSCLHLSANSSPGFDGKNSHQLATGSTAHMSATALLQKAAQIGATSSSSNQSQFASQFMQKEFQETPLMDNNMGMYNGLFNQNHGWLFKNMEENGSNDHTTGLSRFAGKGSNIDTMTLDFLGIGGKRSRNSHKQPQEAMEFEALISGQQRMQGGLSPFQQQISNVLEKPMWN